MPARVAAIAPGPPLAPATFSGIAGGLLGAIGARGQLVGAVDGRPRWLQRAEQLTSFDVDRVRWRQWYNAGAGWGAPALRRAMSDVAGRRVAPLAAQADAVLQLAGWYRPATPDVVRSSYHDGNLGTFLTRPDLRLEPGSRRIRRALAWERALYDDTHVIFTMSEWLRGSFLDVFGQSADKVVAVGAGPAFAALPPAVAREWEEPRLLFVGKDWERKGGPHLLAAWPAVRAAWPDARLTIIGPAATPPGLPAGAEFVGRIDRGSPGGEARLQEAYRSATAFVMPSLYEPFGIAFLEAMAHGLPCVAADRCAMPEIVADSETGRVVDPLDHDAFAAALVAVAEPDTARRMGAAGRRRLEEHYTWGRVADRVLAELEARI